MDAAAERTALESGSAVEAVENEWTKVLVWALCLPITKVWQVIVRKMVNCVRRALT